MDSTHHVLLLTTVTEDRSSQFFYDKCVICNICGHTQFIIYLFIIYSFNFIYAQNKTSGLKVNTKIAFITL